MWTLELDNLHISDNKILYILFASRSGLHNLLLTK